MPHITTRKWILRRLDREKDTCVEDWLLLKRRIRLHEMASNSWGTHLLDWKRRRLREIYMTLDDIYEKKDSIEALRYMHRPPYRVVQQDEMFERLAFTYSHADFKQMARMDFSTFLYVRSLIQDHPVFGDNQTPCRKQREVWQLALLCFEGLGCNGTGASVGRFARQFGVGRGTVILYTERDVAALSSIVDDYVSWADVEERTAISARMERCGFPGCIKFVDGTYAVLSYRPTKDSETFYNRKSHYAYNLLIVCDDNKKIRYLGAGWPGSVHDSTIWKSSPLAHEPESFFLPMQYVLADSGYALDQHFITVYRRPDALEESNQLFNKLVAAQQVRIEHTNGILFSHWSSLKGLRMVVSCSRSATQVVRQIIVCCLLHNLTLCHGDTWEVEHDSTSTLDDEDEASDDKDCANSICKKQRKEIQGHAIKVYIFLSQSRE